MYRVCCAVCGRRLRGAEGTELETETGRVLHKNFALNDDCGIYNSSPPSPPTLILVYSYIPPPSTTHYTTPALLQRSQFCVVQFVIREVSIDRSIIPFMSHLAVGEGFGDCGPICLFFFLGVKAKGAWTRSRRPVYPPIKGSALMWGLLRLEASRRSEWKKRGSSKRV
jgi:hypothetical protein